MGRKIDMKKIENTTKCQVTFSKRRSSLMKKANELSVCCDIEIAVVAFSPSGRVSKYSGPHKMDEVLRRYVNLPVERRLNQISNVQGKMEKLKKLSSHINGDLSKLHYLEKQIENLELQVQKKCLELQILETDLRDYEIIPGQEASLNQLLWCERNLNNSLQKVVSRKMELVQLECLTQTSYPTHFDQNQQTSLIPDNPIAGELLMQLDPWISPLSAKVRESIFQDLVGQATEPLVNGNTWLPSASVSVSVSASENVSNFNPIHETPPISVPASASENVSNFNPISESPPPFIPPEVVQQPLMMDQSILNFHDQNNVHATLKQSSMMEQPFNFQDQNNASGYCSSSVIFSDAMNMSTPDLCNIIQDPIFPTTANPSMTTMGLTQNNEMGMEFQCMNSSLMMSPFSNNPFTNDQDLQDFGMINQIQEPYQPHDPFNPLFGEIGEDNSLVWESNQENSSVWEWEWEELLRDGDFNFPNLP